MVPEAGIEPARLAAGDFESPESTNFTTRAVFVKTQIMAYFLADFAPCFEISLAQAQACQAPLFVGEITGRVGRPETGDCLGRAFVFRFCQGPKAQVMAKYAHDLSNH
ncbi:MAG: hypothetical protein RIS72_1645 [Pseudomonadota bacterium]